MPVFHSIVASRTLLICGHAAHLLAVPVIFFTLSPLILKSAAIAAMVLCAGLFHRQLIQQELIRIRVDPVQKRIEILQSGQPYFFCKYKVYQTRWFAILKLIDQQTGRILVLNPDSFQSLERYRQLRFDLCRLESGNAA